MSPILKEGLMKKKNKRQQQYYWDLFLVKRYEYKQRISIILFSCLELRYVSYTKGISARHYYGPESDDDIWKYLPSTALLNIFCKSELKDRFQSIPLVCKSWKNVTDDPRCWSSMIPDSVSPEDAFIKKTRPRFKFKSCRLIYNHKYHVKRYYNYLDGVSRLFMEEGDHREEVPPVGVSRLFMEEGDHEEEVPPVGVLLLRTLIDKSEGGAAITTLYLSPFFPYDDFYQGDSDDEPYNEIVCLISNCCPNLKHISFDVCGHFSQETLGQLFKSCKKLELIDFSRCYIKDHLSAIEVLGSCSLPNLQGIRIWGNITAVFIAKYLPQLKLLSFRSVSINNEDLSIILDGCLKLQYLHVHECMHPRLWRYGGDILGQAYSQIPEFHYDVYREYPGSPKSYPEYHSADGSELAVVDELNCLEDYDYYCTDYDYYCTDYYDNILQQREVKKEYDYMFQF